MIWASKFKIDSWLYILQEEEEKQEQFCCQYNSEKQKKGKTRLNIVWHKKERNESIDSDL